MSLRGEVTRRAVLKAVRGMRAPTINALVDLTGMSYNSVKAVLHENGYEPNPDTWPRQWRLVREPLLDAGTPRLQVRERDIDIVMSIPTHDNWPGLWSTAHTQVVTVATKLTMEPGSDPKELREQAAALAQATAALAYALQQVEDLPDWYEALGGRHDAEA